MITENCDIVALLRHYEEGLYSQEDLLDILWAAANYIETLEKKGSALVDVMISGSDHGWDEAIDEWNESLNVWS